ncbi:alpha/beta hydrolase [Streptomyces umbrinus]|uniref:alpha/beta hydrolase n=1 Tax=Streptomyces umbrinus TaxID=67370 RepID=UPI00341F0635
MPEQLTTAEAPQESTSPDTWELPQYRSPVEPVRRADGALRYTGISYAMPAGYRPLQMELWTPADTDRPPCVVWIHGGAWFFGDRRWLPETVEPDGVFNALLAAGVAVASIDYRLSAEARFPAQLHDAKAAIRYLRHYADRLNLDPHRIGVWGESAGGHLAALVALTGGLAALEGEVGVRGPDSSVRVCVDWYGLSDLRSDDDTDSDPDSDAEPGPDESLEPGLPFDIVGMLLGSRDPQAARAASPVTYATADAPPFLLMHGTGDVVVPAAHSEILHDALTQAGAQSELLLVDGADHIFSGAPDVPALIKTSVAFLASHLNTES